MSLRRLALGSCHGGAKRRRSLASLAMQSHGQATMSSSQESIAPIRNPFDSNEVLKDCLHMFGASWAVNVVHDHGQSLAAPHVMELADEANKNPPVLTTHGGRNVVEYHPAYHELMRLGVGGGVCSFAFRTCGPGPRGKNTRHTGGDVAHVARAGLYYIQYQTEAGTCCPMTMTSAGVPVLSKEPGLAELWLKKLLSQEYDPRDLPIGDKVGATLGMSITHSTEPGSNEIHATPIQASSWGQAKPFHLSSSQCIVSAPMSDGFLTLAYTQSGVSCFLVPRWLPDGTRNKGFKIMGLIDKCGDRSNATAVVEFDNAIGYLVGPEGQGTSMVSDMYNHIRLDCALGGAALLRQTYHQTLHYAYWSKDRWGKRLTDRPLMLNVLADMGLVCEASTKMVMRVAKAFDQEKDVARIGTALAKYWVTKRVPHFIYEAMEVHGTSCYTEDSLLARHYRQAPLNSIFEPGNDMCMDVLRCIREEPQTFNKFMQELETGFGSDVRYDGWFTMIKHEVELAQEPTSSYPSDMRARRLLDQLALALQASLLIRFGHPTIADAFMATRLNHDHITNYGSTSLNISQCQQIVDRNLVHVK